VNTGFTFHTSSVVRWQRQQPEIKKPWVQHRIVTVVVDRATSASTFGVERRGINLELTLMERHMVMNLAGRWPCRQLEIELPLVLLVIMVMVIYRATSASADGMERCGLKSELTLMERQLVISLAILPFW
jgi:hypothetical protein